MVRTLWEKYPASVKARVSVVGLIFARYWMDWGERWPSHAFSSNSGHRFLGVVELAGDFRPCPVAGDAASDVGGRDTCLVAEHRDDRAVDERTTRLGGHGR